MVSQDKPKQHPLVEESEQLGRLLGGLFDKAPNRFFSIHTKDTQKIVLHPRTAKSDEQVDKELANPVVILESQVSEDVSKESAEATALLVTLAYAMLPLAMTALKQGALLASECSKCKDKPVDDPRGCQTCQSYRFPTITVLNILRIIAKEYAISILSDPEEAQAACKKVEEAFGSVEKLKKELDKHKTGDLFDGKSAKNINFKSF